MAKKKDHLADSLMSSMTTIQTDADTIPKTLSTEEKEKGYKALIEKTSEQPGDEADMAREKRRLTLDLSTGLANRVKVEASKRDMTMKGFIVELLNRYFEEKERD